MTTTDEDYTPEDKEAYAFFIELLKACRNDIVDKLLDNNACQFTTQQYIEAYAQVWKAPDNFPKEFRLTHDTAVSHLRNCETIVEISSDVWGYPPLTEEEKTTIAFDGERCLAKVFELIRQSEETKR